MEKIIKKALKRITETKKIVVMIGEPKNIHTKLLEVEEYKANKDKYKSEDISIIVLGDKLKDFNLKSDVVFLDMLPSMFYNLDDALKVELHNYFNEVTDKNNFESNDQLDKHIDALVEEHMKLYSPKEIENIAKNLLNI